MATYRINKDLQTVLGECMQEITMGMANGLTLEVIVREEKDARKSAQRILGNIWYKDWANASGEDANKCRNMLFHKCAIPIFYRDQVIVNRVNSFDTLTVIYNLKEKGLHDEYGAFMASFVANSSSNSFSVKQNAEYLDSIWRLALDAKVFLSMPEDADRAKFKP